MGNNLSDSIKASLTMEQVAERYGFPVGRGGFIRCPFHTERTGSLKVYDGGRGWHCFGCGKGGSIIDFVMGLFDINFRQACLRLNADFSLNLTDGVPEEKALAMAKQRVNKVASVDRVEDYWLGRYSEEGGTELIMAMLDWCACWRIQELWDEKKRRWSN